MDRAETIRRLNEVFRDVFGRGDISVNEETTASDVEGWDSLRHITLLAAVEDEFGVEIPMEQTTRMRNVGEMMRFLEEEG